MNKTVSYLLFLGICLSMAGSAFAMIPVANPDFEEPEIADGDYLYLNEVEGSPWEFDKVGTSGYDSWITNGYYASEPVPISQALQTANHIVYQELSTAYWEGGAYVFSSDVAQCEGEDDWELFFYDATAGDHSTPVASMSSTDPGQSPILVAGEWFRKSVTLISSPELVGDNIGIGITGDELTLFDNVTVEYEPRGRSMPVDPMCYPIGSSTIGWSLTDQSLLEWDRPEPNSPGEDLFKVNVYFGTSPDLQETDRIEENYDGDSTGNFPKPLAEHTDYYWRVDSIDPNDGNPDIITGNLFHFVTSIPAGIIITETDGDNTVGEQDPAINNDDFILTLSKDPGEGVEVEVTFTEADVFNPLTNGYLMMEAFEGEATAAPELQITHSGGTAVSYRISVGIDDTEEWMPDDWNYTASTDLNFFDDQGIQLIGLRFRNVAIEQGATIDSAIVEFEVDEARNDQVYGLVTGENVDDAPLLVADYYHLQDRLAANPTSSVPFAWTDSYAVDEKVPTSDIASIIQEIVNRPGWVSGNSILLIITEDKNLQPDDLEPVATYTLNQDNWETGVAVTIQAIDDEKLEIDPELATLTSITSSANSDWNGLSAPDVTVIVLENECGAWGFAPLDLNKDCAVDIVDLAMFASQFEMCTDPQYPSLCDDDR